MSRSVRILVADDEKLIRWSLRELLVADGHEVVEACDGDEAIQRALADPPDIALLDIRMPGRDGLAVLRELRERHPTVAVVMVSAHGNLDSAVEAMRLGASDFLRKPFSGDDVKVVVARLIEKLQLKQEVDVLRGREGQRFSVEHLAGSSAAMSEVRQLVQKIASSDASTVLIQGESGTGKGLVAKVLHYASRRRDKPLMEITCTALSETLIEAELFGYEKGAFTDAKTTKHGLFETAHEGTIFLDEVGDLPLPSQAKLLRALEDRVFKRVGGVKDVSVDVRVVAATNRELADEVKEGRFRRDLYYRLAVLNVRLAPLRSRPEDLPALCQTFVDHFNREFRRNVRQVTPEAMEILGRYAWPGNVRELRNVIERAMILENHSEITPADLPADLTAEQERPAPASGVTIDLRQGGVSMENVERGLLVQALDATSGNQTRAAQLLGITRDTLRYRIKKHGLRVGD